MIEARAPDLKHRTKENAPRGCRRALKPSRVLHAMEEDSA